jgi:RNA polymerase sigma factor (sigma-70 family)
VDMAFLSAGERLTHYCEAMIEFEPARLIARIAEHRDRSAFAELFNHYAPRIKTLLIRRGAGADRAEELAQETLLKLWRKAGQYDPARATPSAWVYAIARNVSVDAFRRESAIIVDGEPDEGMVDGLAGQPDQHLMVAEREDMVRLSIAALPEDQLQVIRLSFFDGLAHAEIAGRLGIPLGTVKSRIRLALKRLRERLGELK